MDTQTQQTEIAKTILQQLGGHKFVVMTGAKNLMVIDSGLQFRLPGTMTKNHINLVSIVLDWTDTYKITFENIRVGKRKIVSEKADIYFDQLQSIFISETGLDTHL